MKLTINPKTGETIGRCSAVRTWDECFWFVDFSKRGYGCKYVEWDDDGDTRYCHKYKDIQRAEYKHKVKSDALKMKQKFINDVEGLFEL